MMCKDIKLDFDYIFWPMHFLEVLTLLSVSVNAYSYISLVEMIDGNISFYIFLRDLNT